ncbi:pancreatic lipase-related protein 2-like [Plodia interpunctella]|uniref:pancreatic lipase-related protein 2-like n=1 Tax=Plodia interpunctella TaxID=58824 RepID=UPI00236826D8|nr:pancreatic lipase-related protein 2-like [Plodia interpunctella]
MVAVSVILLSTLALAVAVPLNHPDPVHLSRSVSPSDVPEGRNLYNVKTPVDPKRLARYNPQESNQYHLFTRRNPTVSQPLLIFNDGILESSNYDKTRRTVMLIHGYEGNATSTFNLAMVPAILAASDLNLIVVDWTEGTELGIPGVIVSANSVSQFVLWLMNAAEGYEEDYHLIGLGVGGQYAAIASRLAGRLGHVTALDPPIWEDEADRLRTGDAMYTEVVFTTSDGVKPNERYGQVDFYPNGGQDMPGCGGDWACNHARSYFYMAESVVTWGFTGTECGNNEDAFVGACDLPGRLQMAAPYASYIARGIFYLETNAAPPFSRG